MKRQQLDAGRPSGELDGGTLEQHVEGSLGSAIAIPAPGTVVADAADPGTEHRQGTGLDPSRGSSWLIQRSGSRALVW